VANAAVTQSSSDDIGADAEGASAAAVLRDQRSTASAQILKEEAIT